MAIILRPQTHAEWLELRQGGIGSSEVGSILGVNPFETKYQLWRRKKGLDAPKVETFAMKAGHYLEDAVSRFYADETGKEIIKASVGDWIMQDEKRPYLQVSPDRTFWLPGEKKNNANKGILECKTTQMQVDGESIPKHWFCQLQYQLGVAGYNQGALAWLTAGREFGYRDIDFNADFYAWMTEEIERFWLDNILGNIEPEAENVADILLKNPRHQPGKEIEADAETLATLANLKDIKQQIADLTSAKNEAEDVIKFAIGDAEALISTGITLATWKAAKDGQKFNEKRFKAEHPEMYAEYVETTPGTRRFLIK